MSRLTSACKCARTPPDAAANRAQRCSGVHRYERDAGNHVRRRARSGHARSRSPTQRWQTRSRYNAAGNAKLHSKLRSCRRVCCRVTPMMLRAACQTVRYANAHAFMPLSRRSNACACQTIYVRAARVTSAHGVAKPALRARRACVRYVAAMMPYASAAKRQSRLMQKICRHAARRYAQNRVFARAYAVTRCRAMRRYARIRVACRMMPAAAAAVQIARVARPLPRCRAIKDDVARCCNPRVYARADARTR